MYVSTLGASANFKTALFNTAIDQFVKNSLKSNLRKVPAM